MDIGTLPLQLRDFVWEALVPGRTEGLVMRIQRAEKLFRGVERWTEVPYPISE